MLRLRLLFFKWWPRVSFGHHQWPPLLDPKLYSQKIEFNKHPWSWRLEVEAGCEGGTKHSNSSRILVHLELVPIGHARQKRENGDNLFVRVESYEKMRWFSKLAPITHLGRLLHMRQWFGIFPETVRQFHFYFQEGERERERDKFQRVETVFCSPDQEAPKKHFICLLLTSSLCWKKSLVIHHDTISTNKWVCRLWTYQSTRRNGFCPRSIISIRGK